MPGKPPLCPSSSPHQTHPLPLVAHATHTGTAADLTSPPVTGAPAQASSKASAPIDPPNASQAAKALAARRESATVDEAAKLAVQQSSQNEKDGASRAQAKREEAVKLKQFVQDDRHFSLVRNFRLADIVTLGNGFCGALSLFSSAKFIMTADDRYLWHALLYPLLGMVFDALDGKVARWRHESSMLGQELDSLADSVSFGVAPAFVAFTLGLRTTVDMLILTTFICAGIARLARFNATVALVPKDATGKSKYFEGLPIPSSLFLCGAMAACVQAGCIDGPAGQGSGVVGGLIEPLRERLGVEVHWASLVFLGWASAMVSKTLRIPKF
ncbi:CDP-diacylglycerol-serine O-phosphatidyltransferase [Rhodotorula paludigena]|uniref:CDP-diacylglycerol-serine O-phosphatidyltransferase n=1 Tax=Rhodotorula paludigena TaxID=86838 RepID=UPI00317DED8C